MTPLPRPCAGGLNLPEVQLIATVDLGIPKPQAAAYHEGCRVACGFLLVKWAVDREEVARVVGKVAALFR